MNTSALLMTLVIGALAGWIAAKLMRGHGLGLGGNLLAGIAGAFVGGWLFNRLHVHIASGLLGELIEAVVGAMVVLLVLQVVRR